MNNKLIAGLGVLTLTACQQNTDDIIIEDFESGTYANWTVEGDAFGATPATGSYTGQQPVTSFEGKYLANSFNNGEVVQTNTVFPTEVYNTLRFNTSKGTLTLNDITVYKLK